MVTSRIRTVQRFAEKLRQFDTIYTDAGWMIVANSPKINDEGKVVLVLASTFDANVPAFTHEYRALRRITVRVA